MALGSLDVREVTLAARGGDGAPGTAPTQNGSSGNSGSAGFGGNPGQVAANAGNGGFGGVGGTGGTGGSGGTSVPGATGAGGAGGTVKLSGSVLDATGIDVNASGGGGGASGGIGRFLLGANTGALLEDANINAVLETFSGPQGFNPFLADGALTPFIPGLEGGAEIFGLTGLDARDMLAPELLLSAPADARAAVIRVDTGPLGYAADFDGFDMLLLVNLTDDVLSNPWLGAGAEDYLQALMLGGYTRDASFVNGASGDEVLSGLEAYGVYATLIPETVFHVEASIGEGVRKVKAEADLLANEQILFLTTAAQPQAPDRLFAQSTRESSLDVSVTPNDAPVVAQVAPQNVLTSSLQFDGNDVLTVASSETLEISRQVTIELLFKVDTFANSWMPVVQKADGTGSASRSYSLWANSSGYLHLTSSDGSFQNTLNTAAGAIVAGQWYHFAGVIDRDAGTMQIYLDGELVAQGTVNTNDAALNHAPLLIGGTYETSTGYANFVGEIADLRIWDIARSGEAIAGTMQTRPDANAPGLVGHWVPAFTGTYRVSDVSGNGNHADTGLNSYDGRLNTLVGFDGVNDYLQVGPAAELKASDALTVEAWVYPTGTGSGGTGGGIIVNKEGEYEIARYADGSLRYAIATSTATWSWVNTGANLPLSEWSHIALTFDAGQIRVYVNGILVHSANQQLTATIGFDSLVNNATSYDEDGYRLTPEAGTDLGSTGSFGNPAPGLFPGTAFGQTVTLTRPDGAPFELDSMVFYEYTSVADVVTFTGTKSDGSTLTRVYTVNPSLSLTLPQTVTFDSEWSELVSVSWNMTAVVVDNIVVKIAGILDADPARDDFRIGGRQASDQHFQGYIDEVRVWQTARSQGEIRATLYAPLQGDETGLAGYWNMSNVVSGLIEDRSPNDNHATQVNGTGRFAVAAPASTRPEVISELVPYNRTLLLDVSDADGDAWTLDVKSDNDAVTVTLNGDLLTYSIDPATTFRGIAEITVFATDGARFLHDASGRTSSMTFDVIVGGTNENVIYGNVFDDIDADGQADATEPGIDGVAVTYDGDVVTYTDANGDFRITGVPFGSGDIAIQPLDFQVATTTSVPTSIGSADTVLTNVILGGARAINAGADREVNEGEETILRADLASVLTGSVVKVIDFQDFETLPAGNNYIDGSYSLSSTGSLQKIDFGDVWAGAYGTQVTTLERTDGQAFTLRSIVVRNWSYDTQTIVFTGTRTDGSTVEVTHRTPDNSLFAPTLTFGGEFSDLVSVSWIDPSIIFDDITVEALATISDFDFAWSVMNDETEVATGSGANFGFTPIAPGDYRATLTVVDNNKGNTYSDSLFITALPVNDAPVADDESYSVNEDTVLSVGADQGVLDQTEVFGEVLTGVGDQDPENDPLKATLITGPSHGTLTFVADGSFVYTPNLNFHGTDTFTYVVNDGRHESEPATVTITVLPVNDKPTAAKDTYSGARGTLEDTPLTVGAADGVLANDGDIDGDTLSAILVNGPGNGTLVLNPDGSFVYTPNANFNGVDGFTYRASDGLAQSNPVAVTIAVTPVNDAPLAFDDTYAVQEDTPIVVSAANGVLFNDTDVERNALQAILETGPEHGTLVLNANGGFTYTPALNYFGVDTFTYTVRDAGAIGTTATVTLNIAPVNDAPVATGETYATDEGVALSVNAADGVLGNDTDIDSSGLSAVLVGGPAHGTVVLNGDGSFVYTPAAGYNGSDSFTYRASDGTSQGNVATVGVTIIPDTLRISSVTPTSGGFTAQFNRPLLASQVNLYGNTPADVTLVGSTGAAVKGTLVVDGAAGTVRFLATGGVLKPDTYTATFHAGSGGFADPAGNRLDGNADGVVGDNYTFMFQVDATPRSLGLGDFSRGAGQVVRLPAGSAGLPIRLSDGEGVQQASFTISYNPALLRIIGVNAASGLPAGSTVTTETPASGELRVTVALTAALGAGAVDLVTLDAYVPTTATIGKYQIIDVSAIELNGGSIAAIDNDAVHLAMYPGDVTANGGYATVDVTGVLNFLQNPAKGFALIPNVAPEILADVNMDGIVNAFDTGILLQEAFGFDRIELPPVSMVPLAHSQGFGVNEDTVLNAALSATDADNSPLTFTVVSPPAHGAVEILNPATGAYRYTPTLDFNGTDTFTFRVSDPYFTSSLATATINVAPVNDAPTVSPQTLAVTTDMPKTGTLAAADRDGDALSFTVTVAPMHGTVTLNTLLPGRFTYTPAAGYSGPDSFAVQANDGSTSSAPATVSVNVTAGSLPMPAVIADETSGLASASDEQSAFVMDSGLLGSLSPATSTVTVITPIRPALQAELDAAGERDKSAADADANAGQRAPAVPAFTGNEDIEVAPNRAAAPVINSSGAGAGTAQSAVPVAPVSGVQALTIELQAPTAAEPVREHDVDTRAESSLARRIDRLKGAADQTRARYELKSDLLRKRLRHDSVQTRLDEETAKIAEASWVETLVTDFAALDHGADVGQNISISLNDDAKPDTGAI